jgi:hypothetical protein
MFRSKYTLSEVARVLRRSRQSLIREIEAGLFHVRDLARRTGTALSYEVTMRDLERYLGRDMARRLFDRGSRRPTPATGQPEPQGRPPLKAGAQYRMCKTCGRYKPLSDFARQAGRASWLSDECTDCRARYQW